MTQPPSENQGCSEAESHGSSSRVVVCSGTGQAGVPIGVRRGRRFFRLWQRWPVRLFVLLIVLGLLLSGLPFRGRGAIDWRGMSAPLLTGTLILALGVFWAITLNFSARVAAIYGAVALMVSWLAEVVGILSRLPFGSTYRYHSDLTPQLPGNVPLFIPLAWFVLSGSSLIMLRGTSLLGPAATGRVGVLLARSLLSGAFVAGYDLVLDPLATSVQAWTWTMSGAYFGVPGSNFLGWWFVGSTIHLLASLWAGWIGFKVAAPPRRFARVWLAANLSALVLLAVAVRDRLASLVPLVLAVAVVGPFLIAWWHSSQHDGNAGHGGAPKTPSAGG